MNAPPVGAHAFMALSLDGFIAREDGSIDWLTDAGRLAESGEDFGHGAFVASMDALVIGRGTWDSLLELDALPTGDKPTVVLTRRRLDLPAHLKGLVEASAEAPVALADRLAREGLVRLHVDGGVTVRRFLAAGRLRELVLTTVPVAIGRGRPLFDDSAGDQRFDLLELRHWPCGFVQCRWRVPPVDRELAGC